MRAVAQVLPVLVKLTEWDPDGDTVVWIKPARQAEAMKRSKYNGKIKWEQDTELGQEVRVLDSPWEEKKMVECWLTFEDANIVETVPVNAKEPDGETKLEQMFKKNMSEKDFRAAWGRMDEDLADEWWRAVLKVNPAWDDYGVLGVSK
jgi:hypothetical protein